MKCETLKGMNSLLEPKQIRHRSHVTVAEKISKTSQVEGLLSPIPSTVLSLLPRTRQTFCAADSCSVSDNENGKRSVKCLRGICGVKPDG